MTEKNNIHETTVIYSGVNLGKNITLEPFVILGIRDRFHNSNELMIPDCSFIGSRSTIYAGVVIEGAIDVSDQTTIFTNVTVGKNCRIGPKAIIKNNCIIGDNVRVNAKVFMERVVIGSNVFIGPGTTFTDDMHPPCPRYAECVGPIVVESNISIGANCVICPGVKIGHHSQIYAGAVITKDVAPYSVMAGSPARYVKDFRDLQCFKNFYGHPFEDWLEQESLE